VRDFFYTLLCTNGSAQKRTLCAARPWCDDVSRAKKSRHFGAGTFALLHVASKVTGSRRGRHENAVRDGTAQRAHAAVVPDLSLCNGTSRCGETTTVLNFTHQMRAPGKRTG